MGSLTGKNILIAIPRTQFSEEELFGIRKPLEDVGARVVVLSQNGQEALGMNKTRFKPDGIIVDWNKQEGIFGKYDAVFVIGGKGSPKFLWPDPILPQILTDHYRAGKLVGAIGLSVAVLARASLLHGEAAGPDDPQLIQEIENGNYVHTDKPVTSADRIVTGKDATAAEEFAKKVIEWFQ